MGQTVKVYVSVKCGAWEGEAVLFPPENEAKLVGENAPFELTPEFWRAVWASAEEGHKREVIVNGYYVEVNPYYYLETLF